MIASICGLPASGKSSLINRVAQRVRIETWLEDPESFGFVGAVGSPERSVQFLNQMDFLIRKMGQSLQMKGSSHFHLVEIDWTVCHLHWSTALRIARRIDERAALSLQDVFESGLRAQLPLPDILYWLDCPVETVQRRIEARGRAFESNLKPLLQYLAITEPANISSQLGIPLIMLDARRGPAELADQIVADLVACNEGRHGER